jgi:sorbitol-specific phosphotransferase system component IIC
VFFVVSSGDALALARFSSSSHCNVFLATLGTMCHLSLGVWTNIISVFLFVFVCIYLFLSVYNFFYFVAMLLIRHKLHHNCGLFVNGVFNLFKHCISLEIPVFDSCVGLERLHLFD